MKGYVKALILILLCLAVLIPFASSEPDGLEKVAVTLGVEESESTSTGLMPNYSVPAVKNAYSSTLMAGVIGVFLILGTSMLLGKIITKSDKQ